MSGQDIPTLTLLANAAATLFMVGLIWFVQIVHYPLMSRVGSELFPLYSEAHSRLTSLVVGPPMLIEATTSALLLFLRPHPVPLWSVALGAGLLAAIWLSTALLQIPRHTALGSGFDLREHRALVKSNWLRTAAWSARGVLVVWMLWLLA
ncbi:MAG: hypothetical protein L0G70_04840 [Rubrobacter sp.]|nr:hypothetical protein [Rubrobacter sp.]